MLSKRVVIWMYSFSLMGMLVDNGWSVTWYVRNVAIIVTLSESNRTFCNVPIYHIAQLDNIYKTQNNHSFLKDHMWRRLTQAFKACAIFKLKFENYEISRFLRNYCVLVRVKYLVIFTWYTECEMGYEDTVSRTVERIQVQLFSQLPPFVPMK